MILGTVAGSRVGDFVRDSAVRPAADGERVQDAVRKNVAALLMETRQLRVIESDTDVAWINGPPGRPSLRDAFAHHTFVALAVPEGGAARDLYRLEARVSPSGLVFDAAWVVNLTRSSHSDDAALDVNGTRVATAALYDGQLAALEVRDLSGEDPQVTGVDTWTFWQRMGDRISNLERTGQVEGVALDHYGVESASDVGTAGSVELTLGDRRLSVTSGHTLISRISLDDGVATDGALRLTRLPAERKMTMAFLNWFADRGRGFADQGLAPQWVGTSIELLKEFYFTAKVVQAEVAEVVDDVVDVAEEPIVEAETPAQIAAVEEVVQVAREKALLQSETGDFAWPPAPTGHILRHRAPGEGIWEPFHDDRINRRPNEAPLFYTTWMRPSPHYTRKRLTIIAWDPRRLVMNMRAGTREPIPQTAHRGDGRIPRDPGHVADVVAAFNGGFQTTHIWFGMMVDKKVLLPPRSYGATIALLDDGRPAFGTWLPRAPIPENIISYRQNLQPLVEDGVVNPYYRKKFGGTQNVAGAKDGWTVRSALCYTGHGHVMYFYADFSDHRALANAAIKAGCQYAVHLDMNWGHTGFELYRHLADGERPRDPAAVKEIAGHRIEGVLLNERVRHMNHPTRYLGVDYRDFFYLSHRTVVPGKDLTPITDNPSAGEGRWLVDGLPHNADTPPRMAWTLLGGADDTSERVAEIEVLQLDPNAVHITHSREGFDRTTLMATVPLGVAPDEADTVTLDLGGCVMHGLDPARADNDIRHPAATVVGLDYNGFVWIARLRDARIADVVTVFERRGVKAAVWMPTRAESALHLYQPATAADGRSALLELLPGESQGTVVDTPTLAEQRLIVHAVSRPSRVVRLFPDANPHRRRAARRHSKSGGARKR